MLDLRSSAIRVVFIGGGNMAQALIRGLVDAGWSASSIAVVEPTAAAREAVAQRFGVATAASASGLMATADVVVLAVKPQVMNAVCASIAPLHAHAIVVSVAAGIRATDLARWLGTTRIVRCMPNLAAMQRAGVTGMASLDGVSSGDRDVAQAMLETVGSVVWVDDEASLDGVTALSGSGPAYVFLFMEAMLEAAADLGFDDAQARALVCETFSGAAKVAAASTDSASRLREQVTSKGGTTFAALEVMRERDVSGAIRAAVLAAAARSRELGDDYGRG
ncbi:pyrroline-5-carboxylate reductase [soil metagenome]